VKGRLFNGYIEITEYTNEDLEYLFSVINPRHIIGNRIPSGYKDLLDIELEDCRTPISLPVKEDLPDYLFNEEKIAIKRLLKKPTGFLKTMNYRYAWITAGIIEGLGRPRTVILSNNLNRAFKYQIEKLLGIPLVTYEENATIRYFYRAISRKKNFYQLTKDAELLIMIKPYTIMKYSLDVIMDINAYYRYGIGNRSLCYELFGVGNSKFVSRITDWQPRLIIFEIDNLGLKSINLPRGGNATKKAGLIGERNIHIINCASYLRKYGKVLIVALSDSQSAILFSIAKVRKLPLYPYPNEEITVLTFDELLKHDLEYFDAILIPTSRTHFSILHQSKYRGIIGMLIDKHPSAFNIKERRVLKFFARYFGNSKIEIVEVKYNVDTGTFRKV